MTTPNKLRAWLGRARVGAVTLQLTHEGAGESCAFQQWDMNVLMAMESPEELILCACRDLADSLEEAVRVAIQAIGDEDRVLATVYHKQLAEENAHADGDNAANVSANTIVAQLLRHIEVQQNVMTRSQANIFAAFEKNPQQQKMIERQSAQITSLNETIQELKSGVISEQSAEEREEAVQRGMAWQKVGELAPTILQLAAEYASAEMNGHSNGHAAPLGAPG